MKHILKSKICKKYGEDLWGDFLVRGNDETLLKTFRSAKKVKRKFSFTQSSADMVVRKEVRSTFGLVLRMKQQFKAYLRTMTYRQVKAVVAETRSYRGNYLDNAWVLLETRMDLMMTRTNWFVSSWASRQHLAHGYIKINGVTVRSFGVRAGLADVVELDLSKAGNSNYIKQLVAIAQMGGFPFYGPNYYEMSYKLFKLIIIGGFNNEQVYLPFSAEPNMLLGLYR